MKVKRLLYTLGFIVSVSLVLIIIQMSQLHSLKNEIENVHHQVMGTDSTMSQLFSEVHSLQVANQWVGHIDVSLSYPEEYEASFNVTLTWSFNEIETDASVFLLTRKLGDTEWNTVDAINHEGLHYEATIEVDPNEEYEYQIMSKGDVARSSSIEYLPLDAYSHQSLLFESSAYTQDSNDTLTSYEATFSQPNNQPTYFKVKEAKAIVELGDGEVIEVPLEKQQYDHYDHWSFQLDDTNIYEITLDVTYGNGTKESGIIYPEGDYDHSFY
ncbi:hypothetical protein RYX56_04605 [Alkalihalophilus lindianensis]|uniref:Uncharacterized protein n=1 Tax=Alkalihalophilus lindianensis TaxID=1630542 RepID=A0ABU3X6Z8_9BACI|nr:hypothetical protein [Alkalihalophilus lindianensis]MDV2683655.1 hypothetical protein [Alkalihalophilus lindianensis]